MFVGNQMAQDQPWGAWHCAAIHNNPLPSSPQSRGGTGPGYSPQHQLQVRMPWGLCSGPHASAASSPVLIVDVVSKARGVNDRQLHANPLLFNL